ncbi:MAG: preprotein translocase subunit SecG [Verrucomicrobia bacterium]|nr:preprotein translocase subunit SecG [Verrucomicrobiota bacterium]
MSIVLGILTFILILVSVFLVLIVLMQKSKDGGIGSALGGGAAEAAFGAETNNVLVQATKYSAILFFVLAFLLYLGRISERKFEKGAAGGALPSITAPSAPAASTAATPTPAVAVPATAAPATAAPAPAPEAPKK